MKQFLQFKLISPAIIGGADARSLDKPPTIRPPQIRGQLRFWMRALAGGMLNCHRLTRKKIKHIHTLEDLIFGNEKCGNGLRILSVKSDNIVIGNRKLFPHKPTEKRRVNTLTILENSSPFRLEINTDQIAPKLIPRLQAVFWTWLHLGAIGRRSRRGFGSLQWIPQSGDFLDGFVDFKPNEDLKNRETLKEYLIRGLEKVKVMWGAPHLKSVPRQTYSFFCLHTIDQIFIGNIFKNANGLPLPGVDDKLNGIIHLMHGISITGEDDEWELGHKKPSGKKRQASPIMLRLYHLGTGYLPLMVWSPLRKPRLNSPLKNVYDYLSKKLGITASLMPGGTPLR